MLIETIGIVSTLVLVTSCGEPCSNLCYQDGYKPVNLYLSEIVDDRGTCLRKCETNCQMVSYAPLTGMCSLSEAGPLSNASHRRSSEFEFYWRVLSTERCLFKQPALLIPQVEHNFEAAGASTTLEGSVTLPSPDGYIGSGACVNAIGPNNCITLATNPTGCPYEPQKCVEGFTWTFWFRLIKKGTQNGHILRVEKPGIDIMYKSNDKRIFVDLHLNTTVWYEQCFAQDIPEEGLFYWTHLGVVWKNIIGTQDPEKADGIRMFVNGTYVSCWSNYEPLGAPATNTQSFTLGCNTDKKSSVEACYDELLIFTYPLDDASVAQLGAL